MDIRDYIRMLKRGWPAVILIAAVFVGLAAAYLALTPKSYESTAVLFVSTNNPESVDDLQVGSQFAFNAAATYAQIVDSSTVLGPVAETLRPQRSVDDLIGMITTAVRTGTALIDVTATGDDPEQVKIVADAAADSAATVIPQLEVVPGGRQLVRVQKIRPAVEPSQAVSPNVNRILALGLVVGICVGLAATIATQALDTRIRRVHDLRMLTGVPVLAVLPRLKRGQQHGVAVRDDPLGASGEAFRELRTNVRFLDSANQRSLIFTAVADNVDGVHVPANLAWMLAEAGHRVLLVDLDLRQSTVRDALGSTDGPGMADVLAGQAQLTEVIQQSGHPNLHAVLSGTKQPSPSELLSSPAMAGTLRWMESQYDYVIMHAPPLLAFTDAAVVSGSAGGTLVTVTVGRTRAQELATALMVLGNVGVSPIGLVLTRAGRSALDHKKARRIRSPFRLGRPMMHRLDWDWRNNERRPPGKHLARRD